MGITRTTDYGIRILLYLAGHGTDAIKSGKEISESMGMSYNYFLKIVPMLRETSFLQSHQGIQGGYSLMRHPKEISLYDILEAMQDTYIINQCLVDEEACSRKATASCSVHKAFGVLQNSMDDYLKSVNLQTLLQISHSSDLEKRLMDKRKNSFSQGLIESGKKPSTK